MTALEAYRDDGPLAGWIGRAVGAAIRVDELALTLLGAVPLAAVLATSERPLPGYALAASALAFVVLAGAASRRPGTRTFTWAVPPLLRLLEYAFLITLTALAEPGALPQCFALLGVLAFHHYDAVYRFRHQRRVPPPWVNAVAGGWDGRLLVACVLALTGTLEVGLVVAAVALALVYVSESTISWLRFVRAPRAAVEQDEDDDEVVD